MEIIDDIILIKMNRKELKNKGASMYAEGVVIKCGKYYIHITYNNGKWEHASMETTVNTETDLRDLSMNKQPQYIRNFIEDSNLENRNFKFKIGDKIHHIQEKRINGKIEKVADTNRIDIITDIVENAWGDMQYRTKEINHAEGEIQKIGQVYESWIALV